MQFHKKFLVAYSEEFAVENGEQVGFDDVAPELDDEDEFGGAGV